ncbi:MAG: carboxypeptidase regulatory-like domain-containing protein, partial [Nitrososphaerota archaeon]|nr:carboxypeptidase regulatory-like domain-containing protein [Nitrososphaerota archaeon]
AFAVSSSGRLSENSYAHQFSLSVNDGNGITYSIPSESGDNYWNAGDTLTVISNGVWGRSSGTGQRVASWNVDGGTNTSAATAGLVVTSSITMSSAHTVNFNDVTQYEVTLNSDASAALVSCTSPSIPSDNYWYDSGSAVNVSLNGVWGRCGGSGTRMVGYGINGGSLVQTSTTGAVLVLSLPSISSPQSIAVQDTDQFLLLTSGGSLSSMTPPTIADDAGWYDTGTSVSVVYSYSWNTVSNQSRSNAIAYSVDGGQATTVPRSGTGTFAVAVSMNAPHSVNVQSVTQYHLTVTGGSGVTVSTPSPTGDGFYDANSTTTASSDYVWNLVPNISRQTLVGYTLDSATKNVTRESSGNFTTPDIVFNAYHSLSFDSVAQFYISFSFTNAAGSKAITPTSLSINANDGLQQVPGFTLWMDKGTSFTIASLNWEGLDVKPSVSITYNVASPLSPKIHARVYDATLKVTDYLGIPISGAKTDVNLANGTQVSATTGSDGTVLIPEIPLGTFSASVSYLGVSTHLQGDASTQSVTVLQSPVSYPTMGIIAVAMIVVVGVILGLRSRSGRDKREPHTVTVL